MADVFVVGAATTRFGRTGSSAADLAHEAVVTALDDADVAPDDVAATFLACPDGADADALQIRLGLRHAGLDGSGRPRPEHLSAWGANALHLAARGVATGLYGTVVCLGVDALPDGADARPAPDVLRDRCDGARRYMAASGATVTHLAMAAAKNHRVAPQVVADSAVVAWPLTELMVAPRAAGAAAVVLAPAADGRRAVRVRASVLSAGTGRDAPHDAHAVALAYRRARIGADDLDCAEVHDDTAAAELAAYEALQLIPAGQGPQLVETGFTAFGGVLPVNASGGLLARGELTSAAALAQVAELVCQLRGEAGDRQVAGARTALALSRAPGRPPDDPAAAVTILGAA